MVGDELDRDGVEDGGDEGVERGERDGVGGQRRQRLAARGVADDDDVGAAAAASRRLDAVFSKSGPGGATTITGTPRSMSAMGPCLSSPAAKPSAWM